MPNNHDLITDRMAAIALEWRSRGDRRFIFLDCYTAMTANMLRGVAGGRFHDRQWVDRLLHHFADYYFVALEQYTQDPDSAPAVWRQAHREAGRERHPLQHLFLGINAHINYDLVFAEADLLEPEWPALTAADRQRRYEDHCLVNEIISETIDAVQDQVIEPQAPLMDLIDRGLGRLDEWLITRLVSGWREEVWREAVAYVAADPAERPAVRARIEEAALRRGEKLLSWPLG